MNTNSKDVYKRQGLYRIFGLPARNHDWAAMFEGRRIGNAL